jgi:hypothetical protein
MIGDFQAPYGAVLAGWDEGARLPSDETIS